MALILTDAWRGGDSQALQRTRQKIFSHACARAHALHEARRLLPGLLLGNGGSPLQPGPPSLTCSLLVQDFVERAADVMADQSVLPRRIVKETQRLLTEPGACLPSQQRDGGGGAAAAAAAPACAIVPDARLVCLNAAPGISATPYADNLRYFQVLIEGPNSSPYESTLAACAPSLSRHRRPARELSLHSQPCVSDVHLAWLRSQRAFSNWSFFSQKSIRWRLPRCATCRQALRLQIAAAALGASITPAVAASLLPPPRRRTCHLIEATAASCVLMRFAGGAALSPRVSEGSACLRTAVAALLSPRAPPALAHSVFFAGSVSHKDLPSEHRPAGPNLS